ncbi:unnamed protein product [Umbelopsis ramanniana]
MAEHIDKRIKLDDSMALDNSIVCDDQARLTGLTDKLHSFLKSYQSAKCDPCKVISIVRNALCCFRCALRMLGCRESDLYVLTEKELIEAFVNFDSSVSYEPLEETCASCVGILQQADTPRVVDAVVDRLTTEDYQTKSYTFYVTLPVSLLPRNHALALHVYNQLKEQGLDVEAATAVRNDQVDAKEPVRAVVGQQLMNRMGMQQSTEAGLKMTVVFSHPETVGDHVFLTTVSNPIVKLLKQRKKGQVFFTGDSRNTIIEGLKSLSDEEAMSATPVPPKPVETAFELKIELLHESTLVGGRYIKLSREYSQTPWSIRGQRLTEFSVSESIGEPLKKYFKCDDYKFVTAGREDANVRMLGHGRPFYMQMVNPRIPEVPEDLYVKMEDEINHSSNSESVLVRHLARIQPGDVRIIKEGEQTKRKTYSALVWLAKPFTDDLIDKLNAIGSTQFEISQRTPIRVLQRRAHMVRPKQIYHLSVQKLPARTQGSDEHHEAKGHFARLIMDTEAGTYIKEFVHGDLGRTNPSFASLAGAAADILDLDVLEVDLVWPPHIKTSM